jgi:hypothetical protein
VLFELVLYMDGTLGGMREVTGLQALIGRRYTLDEALEALADSPAGTLSAS